ncbi:hypothetical protein CNMCM6936_002444 [Aspergillus lentulus]|nr:hypothetical protein CNMCM6069_002506 [Aspergillus lentulus]KAF4162165.1 hypothetical protein CNMCM6936_002444 [Aspergillus lentulus]KAF4178773.1 hypothetical protein CNMCM7927_002369 [Aspergillus lentulus]
MAVCHSTSSFRSERWDHDTAEDSQEQWERLVREWQKLTLIERWPYQLRVEFESTPPYSPPENGEEIRRVLARHQTVQYMSVIKYEEMKWRSEVPGSGVPEDKVLDDPAGYNFDDGSEDSWRRVLVRVPGITDYGGITDMNGNGGDLQYKSCQNDEYLVAQAEEESKEERRDLAVAELKIQVGVNLLDREAIESGLIISLWLDEHGNIVWDNRLDPVRSNLDGLAGALLSSITLVELANWKGTRGVEIIR